MRHSRVSGAGAPVNEAVDTGQVCSDGAQAPAQPAGGGHWSRHIPFACVLSAGVVLRWITWRAYRPALLFPDSGHYLSDALTGQLNVQRPSGYSFPIIPFVRRGDISMIPLAQHLLILAVAVIVYAFLLRRQVPAWGAALATVPLLCDPLQLVLEQYVLSDVLFEALVVIACVLLLWRRRPLAIDVAAAGALLGYAAIVRGAGTALVIPAAVAVASLRVGWRRVALLVAAFAVPVAVYTAVFHEQHGVWGTNTYAARYLYGRVTTFVDCDGLDLPAHERPLCPKHPVGERPSSDWYLWNKASPQKTLRTPPGVTVTEALRDFDRRAIHAQPVAFARIVARDLIYGFHPSRTHTVPGFPATRWLFQRHYWSLDGTPIAARHFERVGYGPLLAHPGQARFLTEFRSAFHTPGPLLLLAAAIAVLASLGVGRARRSGDRVACGLLVSVCMTTLLTTAALSGFSWRYQLPQLALLAPSGALGLSALLRRPRFALPDAESTTLRRLTALVVRRRQSDDAARAAEPWVAVAAAVLAGVTVGAAALASGWTGMETAGVLAVIASLVSAVLLLAARWRRLPAALPAGNARSS